MRIAQRSFAFDLPSDLLRAPPPSGHALVTLSYRGHAPENVARDYHEFLDTAEETVSLEIIVSTFQDFLESEIGRSMHEERVLNQRAHRDYNGAIATNARYLMDYILNPRLAHDLARISCEYHKDVIVGALAAGADVITFEDETPVA